MFAPEFPVVVVDTLEREEEPFGSKPAGKNWTRLPWAVTAGELGGIEPKGWLGLGALLLGAYYNPRRFGDVFISVNQEGGLEGVAEGESAAHLRLWARADLATHSGYCVELTPDEGLRHVYRFKLLKVIKGVPTVLAESEPHIAHSEPGRISFSVVGNKLQVWLDDPASGAFTLLAATDGTFASGYVGFEASPAGGFEGAWKLNKVSLAQWTAAEKEAFEALLKEFKELSEAETKEKEESVKEKEKREKEEEEKAEAPEPPVLALVPRETAVDEPVHFLIPVTKGLVKDFTIVGLPAGLVYDKATGWVSGTPTTVEVTKVKVTLEGKGGATTAGEFEWTIKAGPAPTLANPGEQTSHVGDAISLALVGTHVNAWTEVNLPAGLFLTSTGHVFGHPVAAEEPIVKVTVTNHTGTVTDEFTWKVLEETAESKEVREKEEKEAKEKEEAEKEPEPGGANVATLIV